MKALIDGDLFPYEAGGLTKKELESDQEDFAPEVAVGDLLPFELCWGVVTSRIDNIVKATNAGQLCIYLSSPEIKTWRIETATIKPYKGNRDDKEKPPYWDLIRTNLALHYPHKIVEFMEADDALAIEQYSDLADTKTPPGTVICTRDKDLNMVPGWHYAWPTGKSPEKPMWLQDELGGLRAFYTQLLIGDSTDNILSLFGVGPKAACVQRIQKYNTEREMFNEVFDRYKERFGSYAKQFLIENGQLLWMMRTPEDRWNPWEDGRIEQWKEEQYNES